jgi:hypothetical protein
VDDASILDGCTFKLDSLDCYFPYSESLQQFLNSQPSLTNLTMWSGHGPLPPFNERCLPNLTRIKAVHSWLGILIPRRAVTDIVVLYEFCPQTGNSTACAPFFVIPQYIPLISEPIQW